MHRAAPQSGPCRPARPSDTDDVLSLTRDIWGGGDYVPHVWRNWLADAEGQLTVAERGCERVRWFAPSGTEYTGALREAGYARGEYGTMLIFEATQ